MEVSKVTYNNLPLNGTGGEDGKSCKLKMFEWMQSNPNRCKNTNMRILARQMSDSLSGSYSTFLAYLMRGMKDGTISRSGGKKRGNFRINYFHPGVPKELLDTASEDDKRFIAEVHERAEKVGGTVDSEGAIEAKPLDIVATEPSARDRMIMEETEQALPVEEQALPVEVKQTKKGTQITFTININL